MPNFIHLPEFGYLDLDNVVQVFNPSGGKVNLDNAPEIAVRFASPIYDGQSITDTAKVKGPSVEFLITALRLLAAPHRLTDLKGPFPPTDSIGE